MGRVAGALAVGAEVLAWQVSLDSLTTLPVIGSLESDCFGDCSDHTGIPHNTPPSEDRLHMEKWISINIAKVKGW